jgi:hypothetical protein
MRSSQKIEPKNMHIIEYKDAKALMAGIQKEGRATKGEIATLREPVQAGDGSNELAVRIDELEELLLNCATSFGPAGEERQGIRECAKRITFRLIEEGGGMPSRKMRIDIAGKNEHPSVQLSRMVKAQRKEREDRPRKD